jgi:uncharacterized protein
MIQARFAETVTSETALREIVGYPNEIIRRKQLAALDTHCQAFIKLSPFLLIGTTNAAGEADVSPRGDAPGFVQILDETTLVIPERPGNRRIDTLRNILQTSHVGLLFMIPGQGETLRVNGRACIIRDSAILARSTVEGKTPLLAIAVEIDECFLHCAKSIKRAKLWDQESGTALPSVGQIMIDHTGLKDVTAQQLDAYLEESYKQLYYSGPLKS